MRDVKFAETQFYVCASDHILKVIRHFLKILVFSLQQLIVAANLIPKVAMPDRFGVPVYKQVLKLGVF